MAGLGLQPQARHESGPRADDADYMFARRIIGSAEDVWAPLLRQQGVNFRPATFTAYDYATPTGCGTGQSSAGPFYCPSDEHIYLDLAFFNELSRRFGAPGEFARAYVIAHEYGHHVQNLTGVMGRRQHGQHGAARTGAGRRQPVGADRVAGRLLCGGVGLSRQPAVFDPAVGRCGRRDQGGQCGGRRHAAEGKPGLYRARLASPMAPAPSACAGSSAAWTAAAWMPAIPSRRRGCKA